MQLSEEQQLIDKLRKIEALHSRPGTEGERVAAERARERILARLREVEQLDPPVEFRLSLPDEWSRRVMIALLRRYGIVPYRKYGQRRTTIMARVSKKFVDETLWPEYLEINSTLREYLDKVTQRVIAEAIHGDTGEAEQRTALSDQS
jgi:hypothetical protein